MKSPSSHHQHHSSDASVHTKTQRHGMRPTGPLVVSLLVTNLRLLDFDQLPDWPAITVASLGNQDARVRVRNTEFALYQLFRVYDSATTAEKLQPFFPPLEPLQSINLRAALYRCLNELKKNGVLAKETVLRKTMLDECQGEKFWDCCLNFSAVVLRKVTMEKRSRYGRPQSERLGMAQTLNKSQIDTLLPLAVAHRASLFKVLREKQRKKEAYAQLYDELVQKEDDLWQRRARAEDDARRNLSDPHQQDFKNMERDLAKFWVGRPELREALINGDTCSGADAVLIRPFDGLWRRDPRDAPQHDDQIGLLTSLEAKVRSQSQRLRNWQGLHEKFLASKALSKHRSVQSPLGLEHLQFDRHGSLKVRDDAETDGPRAQPETTNAPRHASAMQYDDILTAMREELRRSRNATVAAKPAHPPVQRSVTAPGHPVRKPSVTLDTGAGTKTHHRRSPSLTAVPVRPPMGRRVPSRSRSYAQPKVESQRQPIPLKSELFSPLKSNMSPLRSSRRGSASPSSFSSNMPSPVEEVSSPGEPADDAVDDDLKRASQGTFDSGVGLGIDHNSSSDSSYENSDHAQETSKGSAPPPARTRNNGHVQRPSLAERARMSMAFTTSDDISGLLPEPPTSTEPTSPRKTADPPSNAVDQASLLQRTRHSISLAPQQSAAPLSRKKPSHSRSRTSIYPVNQFETPRKQAPRRSSLGVDDAAGKRVITPRDQLFSPEAEYDSVFKARPKIALSPVPSPSASSTDS